MMVLLILVIAMFVIVGAYVGYHVSQQVEGEVEAHSINLDLELLNQNSSRVQSLQNQELRKSIL